MKVIVGGISANLILNRSIVNRPHPPSNWECFARFLGELVKLRAIKFEYYCILSVTNIALSFSLNNGRRSKHFFLTKNDIRRLSSAAWLTSPVTLSPEDTTYKLRAYKKRTEFAEYYSAIPKMFGRTYANRLKCGDRPLVETKATISECLGSTSCSMFASKRMLKGLQPIVLGGERIPCVKMAKYLEVWFDQRPT